MGWYRSVPTAKTSIPDYYVIAGGGVPSNISLEYGLAYNSSFNVPLTIGKRVSKANRLLYGCANFNSTVTILNENMKCDNLMELTANFNVPINIPNGVTGCNQMLAYCYNFNQAIHIPSSVTWAQNFLRGARNFNNDIIFDDDANRQATIYLQNFLFGCSNFNRSFEVPNNAGLPYLLCGCSNYNMPLNIKNNKANLYGIFYDTSVNFNELPYINVNDRRELVGLYMNCKKFNVPMNINCQFWDLNHLFENCTNFNSDVNILITESSEYPFSARPAVVLSNMFRGCTNFNAVINVNRNLFYYGTSAPTTSSTRNVFMSHMFDGVNSYRVLRDTAALSTSWFNNLNYVNNSTPNLVKSIDLSYMFANSCLSVKTSNLHSTFLNKFNGAYNSVNVEGMFYNCQKFNYELSYVGHFWLRRATSLSRMFYGINKLFIGGLNQAQFIYNNNASLSYNQDYNWTSMVKGFAQSYNSERVSSGVGFCMSNFAYTFAHINNIVAGTNSSYPMIENGVKDIALPLYASNCWGVFAHSYFAGNNTTALWLTRNFYFGRATILTDAFNDVVFGGGGTMDYEYNMNINVYSFVESPSSMNVTNMFRNITARSNITHQSIAYETVFNRSNIRKRLFLRNNAYDVVVSTMKNNNESIVGNDITWTITSDNKQCYNTAYNVYIMKWW